MIILLSLLPWLASLIVGASFYLQYQRPFDYPWIALVGVIVVPLVALAISRKRLSYADTFEKMLPTLLLVASQAFAILLVEGQVARWAMIVIGMVCTLLALELLFLLAFMPSRYPVNGLSRVNMAYVPLIIWYVVSTSVGLVIFLHSPQWIHIAMMCLLGIILFRTTGHPEATPEQNRIWMLVGGVTGLHLGLLGSMLPLSMAMQGAISMLVFSGVLRMRRYLYAPIPSRKTAWIELSATCILLAALLISARWS